MSEQQPILFDNEKVADLVKQYKASGQENVALLGDILSETRALIEVIASKYDRGSILRDDLIQEARLKLIRSIGEYDARRQKKVYSYFSVVIRNAMIDYLRKQKPQIELDTMDDIEEDGTISEGNYVILIVDELRDWFKKRFPTMIAKGKDGEILEYIITSMISRNKKRATLKYLSENYGYTYSDSKVIYESVLVKLRTLMKKPSFMSEMDERSLQPEMFDIVGKEDYDEVNEAFSGLSVRFEDTK